jgi:hypothetical protein
MRKKIGPAEFFRGERACALAADLRLMAMWQDQFHGGREVALLLRGFVGLGDRGGALGKRRALVLALECWLFYPSGG